MGSGPDPLTPWRGPEGLDRAVAQAIDRNYVVFAQKPPPHLSVCTACCMDPALEQSMLSRSPRDLTLLEIREWQDAAFGTLGDDRPAVTWLLPRILELLLEGAEVATAGYELALRRLPATGFPAQWPQDQRDCVEETCLLALDQRIRGRGDIDELLCMVTLAGLPLAPFLARLDSLSDAEFAALAVANWWMGDWPDLSHSTFWADLPAARQFHDWCIATETLLRIDRAGQAGNPKAAALAEALWHLR